MNRIEPTTAERPAPEAGDPASTPAPTSRRAVCVLWWSARFVAALFAVPIAIIAAAGLAG